MKIVMINSVYNRSSTGRIMHELNLELRKQGFDTYAFYGRTKSSHNENQVYYINNKISKFMHVVLSRLFDLHGLGSIIPTLWLIYKLKKIKPKIIHLHNIHGYYLNYYIFLKHIKKHNYKVIWTLHDAWSFTGHCAYYSYVKCDKWKTGCNKCPNRKKYPKSWIIDNSKFNYKLKKNILSNIKDLNLITPSIWLKKEVEKSFLSSHNVTVINNGINLNQFKVYNDESIYEKYKIPRKKILLSVAGEWDERKGLNHLLNLSKMLPDDFCLVIVGVNRVIEGLNTNTITIKRTENIDELAKLYSAAFIFINPTLEDNFPTTNLEALACGTPIITYNSGGSCEAIVNGRGGICLKNKKPNELLKSVYVIKENVDKFSSKICVDIARNYFSKEVFVQKYVDFYHDINGVN